MTKAFILTLALIVVAAGCISVGAYLAYKRIPHWGWFLVIGVAIIAGITVESKHNDNE